MRIRRYIQGHRRGREANRIEREAMRDPFLAEALEGYERSKEDPIPHVDILRRKIRYRNQRRLDVFKYGGIAASLIFILGFGIYFGFHKSELEKEIAVLMESQEEENIPQLSSGVIEDAIVQNLKENESATPPPPVPQMQAPVHIEAEEAYDIAELSDDSLVEDEIQIVAQKEIVAAAAAPLSKSAVIDSTEETLQDRRTLNRIAKEKIQSTEIVQTESESTPVIGFDAYKKYVEEKMIRPTDNCKDIKGKVILTFHIDDSGNPYDIKVSQSLCSSNDQEAIRLIKEGALWMPTDKEVSYTINF